MMQVAKANTEQITCYLHGGHWHVTHLKGYVSRHIPSCLNKAGQNLVITSTDKATYNIKGSTIHSSFYFPVNLSLNTSKYHMM